MQPPASGARLHLQLGGRSLPVLAISGEEALSRPLRFHIELLVDEDFSLESCPGTPAVLQMTGPDGRARAIAGLATFCAQLAHHDGRRRVELHLESRLCLLERGCDTRIFLGRSVPDIAREILEAHGLGREQVRFELTRSYPARPWTLQVQESDLAFLQRMLARVGIFFWSDCEEEREIVNFSDHNSHFNYLGRPQIPFLPQAGLEPGAAPPGVFHHLETRRACAPGEIRVHDRSEAVPAHPFIAESAVAGDLRRTTTIRQTHFATGAGPLDEVLDNATIRSQAATIDTQSLLVQGDLADLYPGAMMTLDARHLDARLSGDYVVRALRLTASQRAGQGIAGEDGALSCEAVLIPRSVPFRAPVPGHPEIPTTFTARVESGARYAQLDPQGRYRVRALFDGGERPHAEASVDLRRLTPYAGPPGELPCGLHAPLQDGAEVLLSCLNGDPDRPMIVGSLPNPETPGPVTSANRSQNRYRTAADNELCMDDAVGSEVLSLRTLAGQNILELNAAAFGQRIRLATEQGAMQLQAKKTQRLQSGDTLTERSGGNRVQVVENRHRTATKNAEIHHQAATDIRQRAAKTIQMQCGADNELTAGKRLRLDVQRGKRLTVRGPEATFSVADGALRVQAAKNIRITGQGGGEITFGQKGGGFVIDPAGNVRIYGRKVALGGSGGVSLNGAVNYAIGAGAAMPAPPVEAPLPVREIPALMDEDAPAIFNLAWSRERVPAGETADALFSVKNFQGGETATVRIYEWDGGGRKDLVDTLSLELADGTGPCRIPWRRSAQDAARDFARDQEAAETGPLEYRFEVDVAGANGSESSAALWLTQTVRVECRNDSDAPLPDGTQVCLTSAAGQKLHGTLSGGQAQFTDVVIGPSHITITGHDHRVKS